MAKTLDVALWGRFFVVLALARLLDILASWEGCTCFVILGKSPPLFGPQFPFL